MKFSQVFLHACRRGNFAHFAGFPQRKMLAVKVCATVAITPHSPSTQTVDSQQ
jgi:hypothetical protein